ncbi:MAG: PleD family two-component system response regulator [Candidatus Dormibacteria bacterium]
MQDDQARAGERVLVVEDDPEYLNYLRLRLGADGWEVHTATDGGAALALLSSQPCDALICDLHMPGVDGLELCRRVRADPRHHALPVMVLSGADESAAVGDVVGLGHVWYVRKGTSHERLRRTLRHLLDSALPQPVR